jgi:hypothetical protein
MMEKTNELLVKLNELIDKTNKIIISVSIVNVITLLVLVWVGLK